MKRIKLFENWIDYEHHSFIDAEMLDNGGMLLIRGSKHGHCGEDNTTMIGPEQVALLRKLLEGKDE